jgi:hypothetical protein
MKHVANVQIRHLVRNIGSTLGKGSDRVLNQNRIPFLDKDIVEILTKATNGLGVVLEHRYYGTFFLLRTKKKT